jgi:molybdopterin-containing oxidoreductase family iron-sulfur binding subunit
MPSVTGSAADHRFRRKPSEIAQLARDLASGNPGAPFDKVWADLQQHRGAAVVVAGESLPPEVQGLVRQLNESLGAVGTTVEYRDEVDGDELNVAGLAELVAEMNADQVGTLVILGANPFYDAPADLDFASAFRRVSLRISHSYYVDETALYCHWHVPAVHELEMWGDALSHDGRASLMQPLIRPLYNGVSPYDFVQALRGAADRSAYEIVRAFWQERLGGEGFEAAWRKAVHDGVLPEGAGEGLTGVSAMTQARPATQPATRDANVGSGGFELSFKPDPTVFDGRYANNAWLQECPKPLTTLVWGNAAFVSPTTAEAIDPALKTEDLVELEYRGRKLEVPVYIMPGHADGVVTLHLGNGRPEGTDVGKNVGVNAYALRTSDAPWGGAGLNVRRTAGKAILAQTQNHHLIDRDDAAAKPNKREDGLHGLDERRELEIIGGTFTFEQFQAAAAAHGHEDHGAAHGGHGGGHGNGHGDKSLPVLPRHPRNLSLYDPAPADYSDNYKWGMVIDLAACIGCNACVVGCQSENNVPTVGHEQVWRGREMHWLRIDRYYTGESLDEPEYVNQPMLCQQCENAPCEVVCPVNATGSTTWCTTAVSARGTARTTARTRSAGSTGSTTAAPTRTTRRSTCGATPTSRSAPAA